MAELLQAFAKDLSDCPAVEDEEISRSWTELNARVNRWADLLGSYGLDVGDHVCLLSHNRVEVAEVLLACMHTGIVCVPVNSHLVADEIAYILADSGAAAVVVDEPHVETLRAALDQLDDASLWPRLPGPLGGEDLEAALGKASSEEPADQCAGGVMFYTSGTTGQPKGVRHSGLRTGGPVASLLDVAGLRQIVGLLPSESRSLLCGPWYHSGQTALGLIPLLHGLGTVIRDRPSPEAILQTIDNAEIALVHLVPIQLVRLLRVPDEVKASFAGDSLRMVWHGAAPCQVEVKRAMIDWWGPKLVEYYGATEGGVVSMISSAEWLARPGSVGRPQPGTVAIIGPDDVAVPPTEVGRVFVHPADGRDFAYHNADEKTEAAHRPDRSYTFGDVGYLDAEGYLFLTDRSADMIITGGVNVYPAEVETALLAHPSVHDAAVFGVPDQEFGESIHAEVAVGELASGSTASLQADLVAWCRLRIAGFKLPKTWRFRSELPRHDDGKLLKRKLRDAHLAALSVGSQTKTAHPDKLTRRGAGPPSPAAAKTRRARDSPAPRS